MDIANTPRLTFCGAAGTVTGSRYLLDWGGHRLLIDCGLFQGPKPIRQRNWQDPGFDPVSLDAIVLTHAHVDHSAYLPRLYALGYRGPIYATPTTVDLCGLILPDSAHLQEEDAEYANRKGYSTHQPALPLYTVADADATLGLLRPLPYHETREILPGLAVQPRDAGHILGSASLTVLIGAGNGARRLVFSGDVGRYDQPILNDPEPPSRADWLLCESTYGDRLHPSESPKAGLADAVRAIADRGGVIVVPAFAIGRTQELIYALRELAEAGQIPVVPVYVDSPMAIKATRIFGQHPEDQDREARALLANGSAPLAYPDLRVAARRDESMAINRVRGPAVIISANGMATGGRILHHLSQRLPHPENIILFVGFQAEGTRGRQLLDGAGEVKIHGQLVPVLAEVRSLPGFSAHADQAELLRWLGGLPEPPGTLFLTHGEDGPRQTLAALVRERLAWADVELPQHLEAFELGDERAVSLGGGQPTPQEKQLDEA
ncbi:MAG TPA: MBL fold metallo-hydrolase [Chloroflexota bacterium]|jgi:metallo-beta-lactamase family protein